MSTFRWIENWRNCIIDLPNVDMTRLRERKRYPIMQNEGKAIVAMKTYFLPPLIQIMESHDSFHPPRLSYQFLYGRFEFPLSPVFLPPPNFPPTRLSPSMEDTVKDSDLSLSINSHKYAHLSEKQNANFSHHHDIPFRHFHTFLRSPRDRPGKSASRNSLSFW